LLLEQAQVGEFLEQSAASTTQVLSPVFLKEHLVAVLEKSGDCIGRYKLVEKIGEGGCGVVYMAEQEQPLRRTVALKVIKLGMDTRGVIARFEAERQALALMDHPNIAKVLDAGATDAGRPYFVMEMVRGTRITDYCEQNRLPIRQRLELFMQVCQAIQHAHQKGVVHRDIKPSNILVTLQDGGPVPKVIDFGIAKATEARLTEKTLLTEFHSFMGTPAYMSPEQAGMKADIDTRSDVYSLGVLLYELVTGTTPFDAEALVRHGLEHCRRTIRESEPVRPSTRVAAMTDERLQSTAVSRQSDAARLLLVLRGDLDWIIMKCLEKDRARRYATANDLFEDVQRYLSGDTILARPPSSAYRFQKFVRRHRGTFAAATAIAATLLIGTIVSVWQAVRAIQAEQYALASQQQESKLRQQAEVERERARDNEARARLNEYVADINLAHQALASGNFGRAIQLIDKHQPEPGAPDSTAFEWRYLAKLSEGDEHVDLPAQKPGIKTLATSPRGNVLAIGWETNISIWDVRSRKEIGSIPKGGLSLAFADNGESLITASPRTVRVWRTSDWTETKSLPNNSAPFSLSADSGLLATSMREGSNLTVRVWDTRTWEETRQMRAFGPMAFSPNGRLLVTDSRAGLTVWPLGGRGTAVVLRNSTNMFLPWHRAAPVVAFSPDSKTVVAPRNVLSPRGVFVLSVWDATTGDEIAVLPAEPEQVEHTGAIAALAFSPDGRTLATASADHSIRLWDYPSRAHRDTFHGHLNEVWALTFSPDGQNLITGSKDGGLKVWPTLGRPDTDAIGGSWTPLGFSTDSRTMAAVDRRGTVAFFNRFTHEQERTFPGDLGRSFASPFMPNPAVSRDFAVVAQLMHDGTVKITNGKTGATKSISSPERTDYFALSPDGRSLVTRERTRLLRKWNLVDNTTAIIATNVERALFSGDGNALAVFRQGDRVELWNVPTWSVRTDFLIDTPLRFGVSLSMDGRLLATTSDQVDNAIRLWDTQTGQLLGSCTGHKQGVWSIAFSPSGKTLATASDDSTVRLWNVATQQELLSIHRLGSTLRNLVFSSDEQVLAGADSFSPTPMLRLFHAPVVTNGVDSARANLARLSARRIDPVAAGLPGASAFRARPDSEMRGERPRSRSDRFTRGPAE
jgi:serine/threonine protein kinase/WD40 repeat protein